MIELLEAALEALRIDKNPTSLCHETDGVNKLSSPPSNGPGKSFLGATHVKLV